MYILNLTLKSTQNINNFIFKYKKKKTINNFFQIKQKKKIFTVLKSPHINKKSRESFLLKNYIKKINIPFFNIYKLFNFLIILRKNLPKDFHIKIKILKN